MTVNFGDISKSLQMDNVVNLSSYRKNVVKEEEKDSVLYIPTPHVESSEHLNDTLNMLSLSRIVQLAISVSSGQASGVELFEYDSIINSLAQSVDGKDVLKLLYNAIPELLGALSSVLNQQDSDP